MTKPRGLTKPSIPRSAAMPRNAGIIIENLNGSSCVFFGLPSSSTSRHVHLADFDLVDLGVDDPFDVALAHLRFEHALGVADAADAEMADIGLGGDEGHRHLVANAPRRRSVSMIMANSYAGPKQEAPCTAPTTIGPGFLQNSSHRLLAAAA